MIPSIFPLSLMENKKWYVSRTLWVNVLAAVALFIQNQYGWILPPETQAYALMVINMVLRVITKQPLSM